jgi:hypothetical protein
MQQSIFNKFKNFAYSIIVILSLVGCSKTPYISTIVYEPTQELAMSRIGHPVAIGLVTDNRGTYSRWVGSVRDGFGIPVKKVYTKEDTVDVVKNAFSEALKKRGIDVGNDLAKVAIEAVVMQFDCTAIFGYEANASIQASIVSIPSKTVIYSKVYSAETKQGGFGGGLYGGYKKMPLLAQSTLNQTIDKFFADPEFMSALENPPKIETPNEFSIEDRLRTLEKLKKEGLISVSQYETKRRSLLDSL